MASEDIGVILKSLRKERKLTLKDLALETGVSISFLSQVERGKSSVTLESLRKIADALNVNPSMFFSESGIPEDFLPKEQPFFYKDLSHGIREASYFPILVTLKAGESKGSAFSHSGHEFIFVIEGTLTVEIAGEKLKLDEQQSIMFDATKLHYWYNLTEQPVKFLVVSSH